MKKALITGITGQDGSYLAEFLLEKGYEVHGIKRRASLFNTQRVDHIYEDPQVENSRFRLHYGDLTDSSNLTRIISEVQPDEVYNLGAQSHVAVSFEAPEYTADVDAIGTLRLLEAIRFLGLEKKTRFYQASTSELYGLVQEIPQKETTPFHPRSPYAVAKMYAYWITVNYREAYGMYACNGILFNHESPRRGETFVTRKITRAIANIAQGLESCLYLGNMDSLRDWGHAKDYVRMQWMMLQQETADDFVIATGKQISVREFVKLSAQEAGYELTFSGEGEKEIATVTKVTDSAKAPAIKVGDVVVKVDPRYFRPAEVETLLGDPTKAKQKTRLGSPRSPSRKCAPRWSPAISTSPAATPSSNSTATTSPSRRNKNKERGHSYPRNKGSERIRGGDLRSHNSHGNLRSLTIRSWDVSPRRALHGRPVRASYGPGAPSHSSHQSGWSVSLQTVPGASCSVLLFPSAVPHSFNSLALYPPLLKTSPSHLSLRPSALFAAIPLPLALLASRRFNALSLSRPFVIRPTKKSPITSYQIPRWKSLFIRVHPVHLRFDSPPFF